MPGTRNSGRLALGGIALAALLAVIGHLEVNEDLSPWSLTISDFAVSDRGGVIDTAMVLLAAATAVLLPALSRTSAASTDVVQAARTRRAVRRRRIGWAEALLAVWAAGLLLAAVVPTNEPGTPMGAAAYVHRYASVMAFLALPVGGWLLANRLPAAGARWTRRFVIASAVLAVAMVWSAYPGDRVLIGLVERLLILAEVAVLTIFAMVVTGLPDGGDHAVVAPRQGVTTARPGTSAGVRPAEAAVTPVRGA
ncbi:DUF998 domain-containing protein [Micromonospora sp. NPDC023737]|uniref:DUF998 domain-containing protein n=1 Tax=unclassified Micromonospora TaxID=2617518 RepID=UPI0033F704AF